MQNDLLRYIRENIINFIDRYEFDRLVEMGEIISHPIETSVNSINNAISFVFKNEWKSINTKAYQKDDNHICLSIHDKINEDDLKYILSICRNLGWFPSKMNRVNKKNMSIDDNFDINILLNSLNNIKSFDLILEAKFDEIIENDKLPKHLYHLTPTYKVDKIFKNGLKPNSNNRNSVHPERVYLMLNLNDLENLYKNLMISDYKKINSNTKQFIRKYFFDDSGLKNEYLYKYTLLEIDNKEDIVFYKDPNFSEGCYTYSNIKPENIKIKEID